MKPFSFTAVNVYFGGTFFPPHLGHHQMLKALLFDELVSKIFVVPTAKNPLKIIPSQKLEETYENRRLLVDTWQNIIRREEPTLSQQKLVFSDIELSLMKSDVGAAAFTVDTLEKLRDLELQKGNALPWVLCVGEDCVHDLHRWKNIQQLLKGLDGVWIFRRGDRSKKFLLELDASLKSLTTYRCMTQETSDVSSTEIRQLFDKAILGTTPEAKTLMLPDLAERLLHLVLKK